MRKTFAKLFAFGPKIYLDFSYLALEFLYNLLRFHWVGSVGVEHSRGLKLQFYVLFQPLDVTVFGTFRNLYESFYVFDFLWHGLSVVSVCIIFCGIYLYT